MQHMTGDIECLHAVGTAALGSVIQDVAHDAQYMAPAFFRRQVAFDAIRVQQQSNLVAVADRGERQHAGKLRGEIALAEGGRAEIPRGADVHQQQNGELALLGEFLDEGTAGASRDVPVDGAHFIAGAVFAYFVEVHAAALEHRMVFAGETVVHEPARADFQLPHATHDGLGGLGAVGRHARSGYGKGVENLVYDVLGGNVFGLGFISHGDTVTKYIQGNGLHVLRGHIVTAVEKGDGTRGERQINRRSRRSAGLDISVEVQGRGNG